MLDKKIVAVKGMNDILPVDAPLWELFENTVQSVLKSYGYEQIRTPIVEPTALFSRSLGQVTDIVEKEMYSFIDSMNGDHLTLRPENTAGVVRAVIEHNLTYDGSQRLWYAGSMFRHERPQRGRYRQFQQVGAEAFGFQGPDIDAEMIMICQRLWDDLGLDDIELQINSIGNARERALHRADLVAYFERNQDRLDEQAQRRLYTNPLRILDTKSPAMQDLVEAAPRLLDYLDSESRSHFEGLQAILNGNNVRFKINHRLVRGMDYYNRTVFEWVTDALGAQGTVCGGGRYDPLVEMIGGQATPACGFAMGVERVLELMKAKNEKIASSQCDVYIAHQGEGTQLPAFIAGERLRDAGLNVVLDCGAVQAGRTFKAQLKRANTSGAAYTLIFGEREVAEGVVTVKTMYPRENETGQTTVSLEELVNYIIAQIMGAGDSTHSLHSNH